MSDELVFNGIDGASGEYLIPPTPVAAVGQAALRTRWQPDVFRELETRHRQKTEKRYALRAGLDPQNLAEAGWGVIFPGIWPEERQLAVYEALGELIDLRREQAGGLFKDFVKERAPAYGENKDAFLRRFGAGPGSVEPKLVPYYLLLVGDPASLPYQFQFELSVSYAVGRINFDTLEEYAAYARSVAVMDRGEAGRTPRRVVFFGPSNTNDKATYLSSDLLLRPVSNYVKEKFLDWQVDLVLPENSTKKNLQALLGGEATPGLLFTASHGLGFPIDDTRQKPFQGSLLCADWPGPNKPAFPLTRDMYMAAEDITRDASLLGLVCFHFACFGAGTPEREDFGIPGVKEAARLAKRPFLSALPGRLLGHPKGGALAVIGHVDRAWSFSFQWGGQQAQTVTFESLLHKILEGRRIGAALEDLSLRYAEFATLLSSRIYDSEIRKPDNKEMAQLWTAHNDARGYALLGDPAVSLPVIREGQGEHGSIEAVKASGVLPEIVLPPEEGISALPVVDQQGSQAAGFTAVQSMKEVTLPPDWDGVMNRLTEAAKQLEALTLLTYVLPDGTAQHSETWLSDPPIGARLTAMTRIEGGKARMVVLEENNLEDHARFVTEKLAELGREIRSALTEVVQTGNN